MGIEAAVVRQDRRQVMGRPTAFEPGALESLDRVLGRVGLVEHEAAEALDHGPDFVDLRLASALQPGGFAKLAFHSADHREIFLVERPAQDVSPAEVHAGELDGRLEDVLLKDHQAVGACQDGS